MRKTLTILSIVMLAVTAITWQSCKKKDDNNNNNGSAGQVLSIQTGARTTEPDKPISYTAVLVDANGTVTTPASVEWSVTGSATLGSFSGGGATATFNPSGVGYGTITAKTTVNGSVITAKVPIGVAGTSVFAVVPSAVIWTTGAGTIDLNAVYIGTGTTTYTYESLDPSIVTVSSTGEITFVKAGETAIRVTANGLTGNPVVYVPVLVVGMPSVNLPVARVAVTPAGVEMFRGDAATLTAKAYNTAGAEVSSTFTWTSQDPTVASVDASGRITANNLGSTVITATASGITGQAEVEVLPDTTIILTPYWLSLAPSASAALTATTYKLNHADRTLSVIPNPALTWSVPTYGMSIFDIATVSASGVVTMRSSATLGLATFVIAEAASPTVQPGVATVSVSDCDCGTLTPGVTQISVSSGTTVNLSITSSPTADITAVARDAANNPVAGATLRYCSNSMAVCTVDASGTITASGPGTATVTVCNGSVSTTITVNVSL